MGKMEKVIHKKSLRQMIQKASFVFSRKYHRLLRYLKKSPYTAEQIQLFQNIQLGEVVYAEMPFTDSGLFEVPEGHRNRPYIVVGKNETSLIAYPSSHKPPKRSHSWQTFKLFHTRNEAYYHLYPTLSSLFI